MRKSTTLLFLTLSFLYCIVNAKPSITGSNPIFGNTKGPIPMLDWREQAGTYDSAYGGDTYGSGISADSYGNSYVTGYTDVGLSGQTQNGTYDYFIAKYDMSGDLLWTGQVGASGGSTYGFGISTDNFGDIYITGQTSVAIDGQKQNGQSDYFIAKYNTDGVLIWSRQSGAVNEAAQGDGISTDNFGNVYVAGTITVDSSPQFLHDNYNYILVKYDKSGNRVWSRQVGESYGETIAWGVGTDNFGNVYITGNTNVGISGQKQNGNSDYFIAKYDANGSLIWTKQVGTAAVGLYNGTYGKGISADNFGNIYVTGYTDVGISGQKQNGSVDYFIAKYSATGALVYTLQVGAIGGYTQGRGISADNFGNIYITGSTTAGLSGHRQIGDSNYFIARYNVNGKLVWIKQVGSWSRRTGFGDTQGYGISTDNTGNIYITGDTDVGLFHQKQNGGLDYFVAKYTNCTGCIL